mgnify:FL=1
MANYCNICETRRPASGTNMLVLGDDWIEFCRPCGETEKLTNGETGEQKSIVEVFKLCGNEPLWADE